MDRIPDYFAGADHTIRRYAAAIGIPK